MSKNDGKTVTTHCSTHPAMKGTGYHCHDGSRSTYPSGGNHHSSGSSQNSNNSVSLSNFSGGNVSGGYSTSGISYKSIIEKTSNAQNGSLLLGEKIINISNGNLKNEDIGVLVQYLQYQQLNLDKFDTSNNQLGYGAVESLFYTFSLARSHTALYNIKYINISHNFIGDDGVKYIASHLSSGQHPNLKAIDLNDNQITNTGYGYIANALKTITQDIAITFQKYKTDLGQKIIKPVLKEFILYASKNGVDTSYLGTNKGAIEYFKDVGKIGIDIAVGYTKCAFKTIQVLTLDFTAPSLTVDYLIEKSGKEALKKANLNLCVFIETCDAFVSPEGVDLAVKGVELLGE